MMHLCLLMLMIFTFSDANIDLYDNEKLPDITISQSLSLNQFENLVDTNNKIIEGVLDSNNELIEGTHCASVDILLDELEKLKQNNDILNNELIKLNSIITKKELELDEIKIKLHATIKLNEEVNIINIKHNENINIINMLKDENKNIIEKYNITLKTNNILESKLTIEKNEKQIARLSYNNCILELNNLKDSQDEEYIELQLKYKNLENSIKKQYNNKQEHIDQPIVNIVSSDIQSNIYSNKKITIDTKTDDKISSIKVESNITCNIITCLDQFLITYVYYWIKLYDMEDIKFNLINNENIEEQSNFGINYYINAIKSYFDDKLINTYFQIIVDKSTDVLKLILSTITYLLNMQLYIAIVIFDSIKNIVYHLWIFYIYPSIQYIILQPFIQKELYHWELFIQLNYKQLLLWYQSNLEDIMIQYILIPYDYIMEHIHQILYYTYEFLSSDDGYLKIFYFLEDRYSYILWVINDISSYSIVVDYLGTSSIYIISGLIHFFLMYLIYKFKRIFFGILSAILIILLSPILLIIYTIAKLFSYILRKKKITKKVLNKGIKSNNKSTKLNTIKNTSISTNLDTTTTNNNNIKSVSIQTSNSNKNAINNSKNNIEKKDKSVNFVTNKLSTSIETRNNKFQSNPTNEENRSSILLNKDYQFERSDNNVYTDDNLI